jgi:signal transduction histidine kinase
MEKYGRSLLTPLGMEFAFSRRGNMDLCVLSGLQSFSIYLIFKESLTNIVKHARAGRVDVTVSVGKDLLTMKVVDDGEGFSPEGVLSGQYGTTNLRARAEELGADLRIITASREGTKVEFTMPLRGQKA